MRHILLCLFILVSVAANAQVDTSKPIIFGAHPEIPPQFPGGDAAWLKFIQENTVYPQGQLNDTLSKHKVVIEFIVTEEGKITDVCVARSAGKTFDDEELRVVSLLPDFKPGKLSGKPVKTRMILPIVFKYPR